MKKLDVLAVRIERGLHAILNYCDEKARFMDCGVCVPLADDLDLDELDMADKAHDIIQSLPFDSIDRQAFREYVVEHAPQGMDPYEWYGFNLPDDEGDYRGLGYAYQRLTIMWVERIKQYQDWAKESREETDAIRDEGFDMEDE